MTTVLSCQDLDAGYNAHPVVRGLSLEVEAGQVVTLLGPNGAGKTTTLMTLAGAIAPVRGEVSFLGSSATPSLVRRARQGLGFVSEERSVFMGLSARDNLRVGRCAIGDAIALFPELERLLDRRAGLLSGGEQQMLTLARALARKPRVLLVDELSLGLAPLVVNRLLEAVRAAADRDGVGVLLVEQHIHKAIRFADVVHVMRRGELVLSGSGEELRGRAADIQAQYLTVEAA